jgi:Fic family protein
MTKYLQEEKYQRILDKKKQLDAVRPLPKTAVQKLKHEFELEWTYNSNAIEGNTLSLQETRLIIEEGITIGNKSMREHFEAINHKKAIDYVETLSKEKTKMRERDILQIHNLIMTNLNVRERGQYRISNVYIAKANFIPVDSMQIPAEMLDFYDYINKNPEKLNPVELSAMAHFKLVHIHPFVDGNGRVARLVMNLMLMKHGFPIVVVLKSDRKMYYQRLRIADKGNVKPFVEFISKAVERSLGIYLRALKSGIDKYISLQEATKYCDYSQEYLSLLARKGKIDAIKLKRNWVTTKQAVLDYVKSVSDTS